MRTLELENLKLTELTQAETHKIEGGIIFGILLQVGFQIALAGVLASGIYASYENGYNQATK
jgi:hypothetical protein